MVAAVPSPNLARAQQELVNAFDLSKCPGYAATNVQKTGSTLTADLKIDGKKCNAYSDDLEELKLLVEYQSSKCRVCTQCS